MTAVPTDRLPAAGDALPSVGSLEWDSGRVSASLTALCREAAGRAEEAIRWYQKGRVPKRLAARFMRGGSIVLAGLAGILPMVAQSFPEIRGVPLQPVYASILLALAGFFVLFDRFFGYSSAWMRYTSAELELREALDLFHFKWETERASWGGRAPDPEQVQKAVASCAALIRRVNAIVRAETGAWMAEFQDSLRRIDEQVKSRADAVREAAASGAANAG